MARLDKGRPRAGALSGFRAALLARRAQQWSKWGTPKMLAEHVETDRAIRAGESLILSHHEVFSALYAMGDARSALFAWGGGGYGRDWVLSEDDELTPADDEPSNNPEGGVRGR